MSEEKNKTYRLFKVSKELNVSSDTLTQFLNAKGHAIKNDPNEKLSSDQYELLLKEYASEKKLREKASQIKVQQKEQKQSPRELDRLFDETEAAPLLTAEDLKSRLFGDSPNRLESLSALGREKKTTKMDPLPTLFEAPAKVEPLVVETTPPKVEFIPEPKVVEPVLPPPIEKAEPPKTEIKIEPVAETVKVVAEQPPIVHKVEQPPVVEPPVKEVIVTEKPIVEAPVTEKTVVAETTAPVAPVAETPIKEAPAAEKPVVTDTPKNETANHLKVGDKIDLSQFSGKNKRPDIRQFDQYRQDKKTQQPEKKTENKQTHKPPVAEPAKEKTPHVEHKKFDKTPPQVVEPPKKVETPPVSEPKQPVVEKAEKLPLQPETVAKTEETTPPVTTPAADNTDNAAEDAEKVIRASDNAPKLQGLKVVGKIDLPDQRALKQKEAEREAERRRELKKSKEAIYSTKPDETNKAADDESADAKKKRKRKRKRKSTTTGATPSVTPTANNTKSTPAGNNNSNAGAKKTNAPAAKGKEKITEKETNTNLRSTLSGMNKGASRKRQMIRRDKRTRRAEARDMEEMERMAGANLLEVTEFLTANELANLMDVSVNEVIGKCMEAGLFVSINQRIDREVIELIAAEFGYDVRFISLDESYIAEDDDDEEELLEHRPPIVTVMGHVDHGKTSLLDYIRRTNVIAGEAGGITQHIGAYEVTVEGDKKICFLDTPGHEAFTAMRARGAQVTDIAIIVIAADDQVMPQTREAINHAQAAGVPMIFAINKVDKPGADPQKIREQLAQMNLLVEDWGGNYQCQEISAKKGLNIELLLEKVLLQAEMLELKANPNKRARGTVIEAQLDKGRGVVSTVLVQSGTLRVGDILLANTHHGRVKAMLNERNQRIKEAGPSTPVQILGLDGVPAAGDKFQVMETEREARELAGKRHQLMREQSLRMQKHITLEEIARRAAAGDFKELNVIIKADVDGSAEALADSLIKLSTNEVVVRIIMKGVGQITETDVMLASASNAIICGFQVRPSANARKLAAQEQIDVRLYSVIYQAINEIKDALEGLLSPDVKEEIQGVAEVREVFKITKVGTVAGCMVSEGKITRNAPIRLIRDGVVIYTGRVSALKRFKDDVREVLDGYECGISIENFNDIKVGDHLESFTTVEVKRTLD